MKRVRIIVSGRVQGVFYRAETKKMADKLKVKGFIRNVNNNVEAVFEGSDKDVDRLVEFCRNGPIGAIVEDIRILEEKYKNEFKDFEIRTKGFDTS